VLCNASKWFRSSLCGGFREAHEREITLKNDYDEGLEGLFEFSYRGTYTACTADAAPGLETAIKSFLQDARVFVVGDKYMNDELVGRASDLIRGDVEYGLVAMSLDDSKTRRFLKWAVETVYLRQHVLGFEEEVSDSGVGNEDGGKEGSENTEKDPDVYTADDFDPKDLNHDQSSRHPLDRLRHIIVNVLVEGIWAGDHDELERKHLTLLAKQIPQFSLDLAVAVTSWNEEAEEQD
jgi:hypothetical protein